MIEHDLQYLRDMATIAMTDHSSRTKGQPEAFEGFVLANTTRYLRRKPPDITVNGRRGNRGGILRANTLFRVTSPAC